MVGAAQPGQGRMEAQAQGLLEQRRALPIASAEGKLVEAVREHDTLIVVGETGSGKTTQLPQFLHAAGLGGAAGVVGVTQPRRVAAVTVAVRVAQEMGVGIGQEVGYCVRFEDATSASTRIKYMTDGMLLREALLDPQLRRYGVIVVDEAHERTVHTDVLFALLKGVQARRRRHRSSSSPGECGPQGNGKPGGDDSTPHGGPPAAKRHKGQNGHGAGSVSGADRWGGGSSAGTRGNGSTGREDGGLWRREVGEDLAGKRGGAAEEEDGTGPGGGGGGGGGEDSTGLAPLKLVVMSATLDVERFCQYFEGAAAVYVRGRQYPVEVYYTRAPEADYLDAALTTVLQIHVEEEPGDVLVFLTGQEEIEALERLLQERAASLPRGVLSLAVAPIYAALPSEQQLRVFKPAPPGSRKVILATNIAETSVTIPGIRYVVDPGLVKARAFNAKIGVESLAVVPISKAQARQRSGRAGREAPGKCYRLYTEGGFDALADATVPEIRRCNLASVVLQLTALGIRDIPAFDFMDKPPQAAILKALEHLYVLGALTREGQLSQPVGVQMARFPLDPLYSRAVLVSEGFGCAQEMLAAVAMLSAESVFFAPKDKLAEANAAKKRFASKDGDHVTLVNVFRAYLAEALKSTTNGAFLSSSGAGSGDIAPSANGGGGTAPAHVGSEKKKSAHSLGSSKRAGDARAWCRTNFLNARALNKALDIFRQLRGYCEGLKMKIISCGDDMLAFRRALAAAFFVNAARRQPDNSYRALASGQTVSIHPSSVLFSAKPECVVFNALVRTNRQYIRDVTVIEPMWLVEMVPNFYKVKDVESPALPKPVKDLWN